MTEPRKHYVRPSQGATYEELLEIGRELYDALSADRDAAQRDDKDGDGSPVQPE